MSHLDLRLAKADLGQVIAGSESAAASVHATDAMLFTIAVLRCS